jgi:hypothetical protein
MVNPDTASLNVIVTFQADSLVILARAVPALSF